MGKKEHRTKSITSTCNDCKKLEILIHRYNARCFDPCVYLQVCYCGKNFQRSYLPDENLGPKRFALDYHITGVEETVQLQEETIVSSKWVEQVGALQELEPPRKVDILNVQMRIKTQEGALGENKQAELESEEVPLVRADGAEVRVLCGKWKDKVGPLEGLLTEDTSFFDITLLQGTGISFPLHAENNTWLYVFGGRGCFGRNGHKKFGRGTFLHVSDTEVYVSTPCEGVRFLLFSAPRLEKSSRVCMGTDKHICLVNKNIDFERQKE